jgi:hypothetical protein
MVSRKQRTNMVHVYVRTYVDPRHRRRVPWIQRYVDQGSQTTPGRAAEAYAAIKAAKYADQPNFVPFIVETGGYINRRAHLFLDTLRGSQKVVTSHYKYTCTTLSQTVRTYHGTIWYIPWYTCTNITLSQKQLEIQALRCNGDTMVASGRCQHRRHHGILQLRFQLDSDVCAYVRTIGTCTCTCTYTYTCTNITLSQRTIGTYVHVYHGTRIPWYQMVHVYCNTMVQCTYTLVRTRIPFTC